MSDSSKNFVRDGFYAHAADEVKCLDLELNVLESTEDVTARVNGAVPAGAGAMKPPSAPQVFAEIEKSPMTNGLVSDVITLYQGAPTTCTATSATRHPPGVAPAAAAFFGGPDNFEYRAMTRYLHIPGLRERHAVTPTIS